MPRLGQLLWRARQDANMSVDDLADCVQSKALADDPTWLVSRNQVHNEILYIERNDATRLTGSEHRTFWNSVLRCLKQKIAYRASYKELVEFLINQALPPDIDPWLSSPD